MLIVFVFAITYGALVLPRLAERFGKSLAGGRRSKE